MKEPAKNTLNSIKDSVYNAPCFSPSHFKTLALIICLTPYLAWSDEIKTNASVSSQANNPCAPERIAQQQNISAKTANNESATQNIEADKLSQPSKTQYLLQGGAVLKQPGLVALSDEAIYDKQDKTAAFNGHVEIHQSDLIIKADTARINNEQETAVLTNTQYQMLPSRTHGKSKKIQVNQKNNKQNLLRHHSLLVS